MINFSQIHTSNKLICLKFIDNNSIGAVFEDNFKILTSPIKSFLYSDNFHIENFECQHEFIFEEKFEKCQYSSNLVAGITSKSKFLIYLLTENLELQLIHSETIDYKFNFEILQNFIDNILLVIRNESRDIVKVYNINESNKCLKEILFPSIIKNNVKCFGIDYTNIFYFLNWKEENMKFRYQTILIDLSKNNLDYKELNHGIIDELIIKIDLNRIFCGVSSILNGKELIEYYTWKPGFLEKIENFKFKNLKINNNSNLIAIKYFNKLLFYAFSNMEILVVNQNLKVITSIFMSEKDLKYEYDAIHLEISYNKSNSILMFCYQSLRGIILENIYFNFENYEWKLISKFEKKYILIDDNFTPLSSSYFFERKLCSKLNSELFIDKGLYSNQIDKIGVLNQNELLEDLNVIGIDRIIISNNKKAILVESKKENCNILGSIMIDSSIMCAWEISGIIHLCDSTKIYDFNRSLKELKFDYEIAFSSYSYDEETLIVLFKECKRIQLIQFNQSNYSTNTIDNNIEITSIAMEKQFLLLGTINKKFKMFSIDKISLVLINEINVQFTPYSVCIGNLNSPICSDFYGNILINDEVIKIGNYPVELSIIDGRNFLVSSGNNFGIISFEEKRKILNNKKLLEFKISKLLIQIPKLFSYTVNNKEMWIMVQNELFKVNLSSLSNGILGNSLTNQLQIENIITIRLIDENLHLFLISSYLEIDEDDYCKLSFLIGDKIIESLEKNIIVPFESQIDELFIVNSRIFCLTTNNKLNFYKIKLMENLIKQLSYNIKDPENNIMKTDSSIKQFSSISLNKLSKNDNLLDENRILGVEYISSKFDYIVIFEQHCLIINVISNDISNLIFDTKNKIIAYSFIPHDKIFDLYLNVKDEGIYMVKISKNGNKYIVNAIYTESNFSHISSTSPLVYQDKNMILSFSENNKLGLIFSSVYDVNYNLQSIMSKNLDYFISQFLLLDNDFFEIKRGKNNFHEKNSILAFGIFGYLFEIKIESDFMKFVNSNISNKDLYKFISDKYFEIYQMRRPWKFSTIDNKQFDIKNNNVIFNFLLLKFLQNTSSVKKLIAENGYNDEELIVLKEEMMNFFI